jgi:hypothetical protein
MQKFSPDRFISLTRSAMNNSQLVQIFGDRAQRIHALKQVKDDMSKLSALCAEAKLLMTIKTIGRVLELIELQPSSEVGDTPPLDGRARTPVTCCRDGPMAGRCCNGTTWVKRIYQ